MVSVVGKDGDSDLGRMCEAGESFGDLTVLFPYSPDLFATSTITQFIFDTKTMSPSRTTHSQSEPLSKSLASTPPMKMVRLF